MPQAEAEATKVQGTNNQATRHRMPARALRPRLVAQGVKLSVRLHLPLHPQGNKVVPTLRALVPLAGTLVRATPWARQALVATPPRAAVPVETLVRVTQAAPRPIRAMPVLPLHLLLPARKVRRVVDQAAVKAAHPLVVDPAAAAVVTSLPVLLFPSMVAIAIVASLMPLARARPAWAPVIF